jgi:uncharacterized protein
MRRNDKEIKDKAEIESIIKQAQVCRIGISEKDIPYIVPMNFGYENNCLYFHSAIEGKMLDMVRKNSSVCFEMDVDCQIVKPQGPPCSWTAKYRSVIGSGKAIIIENVQEKLKALNIITGHYGGGWYEFSRKDLDRVSIITIEISSLTGKVSGY